MRERSRIPKVFGATLAMGILILDNQFAINAVAEGLQLCFHTVIPALFPFFVLSTILASSMGRLPKFFLRLFKVSPAGGSILLTGLLGGYPVGAKNVGEAYADGYLSKAEAERLLPICNQCGPAFIFGLSMQVFQDVRICVLLWVVQLISILLTAQIIPTAPTLITESPIGKSVSWSEALQRGLRAMANVCGWIILFRLVIQFLQRWFLWKIPLPYQITVSGILELTNGCTDLHRLGDETLRFMICVGIMSFGGLCVTMQSFSVLHPDLSRSYYFPGKVLQVALVIILTSILQRKYNIPAIIALLAIICCVLFFRKSKKAVAIPGKVLYNNPIKDARELLCSSEKR